MQPAQQRSILPGHRISHLLRVDLPNAAPYFISLGVEKYVGGCVLEVVDHGQLASDILLDVDPQDLELGSQFTFEPIHDGLLSGAGNSIWRLKFQKNGRAQSNRRPHGPGIAHKRCLLGVQD